MQPQQQLSQIEKSVTHLLVATKQLLETLTEWSRGEATENNVSDVYVRLGYEFNIACRAFTAIGIETSDLGPVPDLLRGILEDTLSQEASKESLDRFLPRIRDIIINLLHGLKKKQQKLRPRSGRENGVGISAAPPRQSSVASNSSAEGTIPNFQEDRSSNSRPPPRPREEEDGFQGPSLPARTTSAMSGRDSPSRQDTSGANRNLSRGMSSSRGTLVSSDSSMSSEAMQNMPVIAPYPQEDTIPTSGPTANGTPSQKPPPAYGPNFQHPPPPPPKQQDALAQLQKGGELERRASRRFSAYQISKHLGASTGGMPMMPTQNGPIPNRGRDVRESMNAVRNRGPTQPSQQRSAQRANEQPSVGQASMASRISEESNLSVDQAKVKPPAEPQAADSPITKTPEDKLGPAIQNLDQAKPGLAATINGPVQDYEVDQTPITERKHPLKRGKTSTRTKEEPPESTTESPPQKQFIPEDSPQPGKELTLFLQYKSKIKKYVLADGYNDLTIAKLQLAFIEKFNWNTQHNGMDLPEIYIQDPISGVRHELEDLSDIKDRSVLVLNIEALDEVKRHIDDGIDGLRSVVESVRTALTDQQSAIQRVSDRQQEAAKEIASIAAAPSLSSTRSSTLRPPTPGLKPQPLSPNDHASQLSEVQALRRELAVVRQTYTSFASDIQASMKGIKDKAASVKSVAIKARVPSLDGSTGRAYVEVGKKTLDGESSKLVNRVDDLQDIVEDLRKDVVTRGVRPRPRQLETVSRDISSVTAELKKLQEFLRREKPVWSKVWEKELMMVCEDRELLSMQEDLATDLADDLEKAAETFALVEEATRQQNAQQQAQQQQQSLEQQVNGVAGTRSASGKLNPLALDQGVDPAKAKDGVLGEVRALQPNHETRLEAIARAERARERELASRRGGEFQAELGNFVEEGRLKRTGGVEEAERLRKAKDDKSRKEVWERMNGPIASPPPADAAESKGGGEESAAASGTAQTAGAQDEKLGVSTEQSACGPSSPEPEFVEAKEEHAPSAE
ncbi:MAG: Bud site selection protein 6 [Bathelium mastoideum]|nr:MAG: Bud site selection protein 6 [Bathelium mastoideum]